MFLASGRARPAAAARDSGAASRRPPLVRASAAAASPSQPDICLIASDVDGTLLDPSQELTPRVAVAVHAAAARAGVPLIVATGKARGPWADAVLPRLQAASAGTTTAGRLPPPMPGVFLQGLLVADAEGRTLWSRSLEEETLLDAIRLARQLKMTLTAYAGDRIVAEALDEHTDRLLFYKEPTPEALGSLEALLARGQLPAVQKVIFMASAERAAGARPEIEAALGGARGAVTTALPGMVELLPPGASKGAGLRWLLDNALPPEVERRWRERQEQEPVGGGATGAAAAAAAAAGSTKLRGLMAMGDGENDREMLEMAEWGVAMGNAGEALKARASAVVATNAEDGVAEAIERFVLAPRGLLVAQAAAA